MSRYWVRAGVPLVYEELGGATAVFDPYTGETHYVSELPVLLLSCIDAQPALPEELISRLAGDVELDKDARSQVLASLVYLEAAELVESLSSDGETAA